MKQLGRSSTDGSNTRMYTQDGQAKLFGENDSVFGTFLPSQEPEDFLSYVWNSLKSDEDDNTLLNSKVAADFV